MDPTPSISLNWLSRDENGQVQWPKLSPHFSNSKSWIGLAKNWLLNPPILIPTVEHVTMQSPRWCHYHYVQLEATYPKVPITLVETWRLPSVASLAKPKSETFGVKSSSNNILPALKSRCMTRGLESSCRYARALAAPRAIFIRASQSRGPFPLSTPEILQVCKILALGKQDR